MSEVRTIFGVDYDELEPYVKDEYNQRVEWSELYPEWKAKHPGKKGYGDWDEVYVRIRNSDTSQGWGGSISSFSITYLGKTK